MTEFVKNAISSQYFKFIFQLTLGSFIAQIITIIASPISTRLYTPEQLGIYTLVITIVSLFGPVMCGKYDMSIVSAKDEKEAMELVVAGAFFSIVFLLPVIFGYRYYLIINPEIIEEIGGFAYLLIGILIVTAFINILTSYNNRHKEYKTISSVYILRTIVQNIGLIMFGLLKAGSIGLLFSQFFGLLFGLKKQSKHLVRSKLLFREVSLEDLKSTMLKYKNQPLFSMPSHFVNSASYSILNFFISGLFGFGVFGYYSMSYRILGLPLSLISTNVSKVFFQKASEEKNRIGNYNKILIKITLGLVSISIPMVILLMIFGPLIFETVFGQGWHIAGVFVRILAPMYGLRFVVTSLSPALIVSGRQKLELLIQSLFIVSSISSYCVCKLFGFDINILLTIITISYSIIYILFYIIIYRLSKRDVLLIK